MQSKSLITIIIVLLKDQSFTPIHHLGFFLSTWQLSLWYFYLHALLHLATPYMDELAQCSDAGCIT